MKKILVILLIATLAFSCAQKQKNYSKGKEIWAKSFIDQKAPPLVVEKWLSETPITEGKYLLIDFWATWCGPCRKLIPELNVFQETFKDELIVIGISKESEEKIQKMESPSIEYYNAIDREGRMNKALEISGIPHCIIVNPEGIVVWEGFPMLEGHELTAEVIRNLIKQKN